MFNTDVGKYIDVGTLIELLSKLQTGTIIQPNTVGNLLCFYDGKRVAYIDLNEEKVAYF